MAGRPGFAEVFAGLPVAILVVDPDDRIAHANGFAEEMLYRSERAMTGQSLASIVAVPETRDGHGFAIYDADLGTVHGQSIRVDIAEAALPDFPGWRAISLHPAPSTRGLGHSADRIAGARAATGAAAMLAHEIKNPLSGIRGAAQLLDGGELTTLIVTEVDRIAALIDRMQDFTDTRPLPLAPENIYPILAHAKSVALSGFARRCAIEERFDPSLPDAAVNRDALTQILLNLLKNAAEAIAILEEPRLTVTTSYRHGMAVSAAPGRPRVPLPIEICVIDNGPGAPAEIADNLFDAFVSGRSEGLGLGLALVDKLARDMGGVVQYSREGQPERTVFRLLLPRASA